MVVVGRFVVVMACVAVIAAGIASGAVDGLSVGVCLSGNGCKDFKYGSIKTCKAQPDPLETSDR